MKFIFLAALLFAGTSHAFDPVVGYGWSDSVLPAKNQEAFFTGFLLAMQSELGENRAKELIAVEQSVAGGPLGALNVLQKLRQKNVKMIVGFPTSHEAVLVAKATQDINIIKFFASAGHSSLAEFGSTVYTTGEAIASYMRATLDLINKKFPRKNGLLIYNPKALFSLDQRNEYLKRRENSKVSLDFAALNEERMLNRETLDQLKDGKFAFIVLTPYADESAGVLSQLNSAGVDLPIITNSSWTTGDIEMIRRIIAIKKSPIYAGTVWASGSKNSSEFEKRFKSLYGGTPTAESASGYDLGMIVSQIIKRSGNDLSAEGLLATLRKNRCFSRTTAGQICFPKTGGHGDKALEFMRMTKNGLTGL